MNTIGKVTNYAIRIEFQVRGLPHVHSYIWIVNPPKLSEETLGTYIEFIDTTVHANFPAPDDDLILYDIVNQYQTHKHSKIVENIKISYAGMGLVNFEQKKQLLNNHYQMVLKMLNAILFWKKGIYNIK